MDIGCGLCEISNDCVSLKKIVSNLLSNLALALMGSPHCLKYGRETVLLAIVEKDS